MFPNAGMPHPAGVAAVKRSAVLMLQAIPAEGTTSRSGLLFRLVQVAEENSVPAQGRAIGLRLSSNRVTECLIQECPAAVALLPDIKPLRTNVEEFGSG
jgi:hypothetical protein